MSQPCPREPALLRRKDVQIRTGLARSTLLVVNAHEKDVTNLVAFSKRAATLLSDIWILISIFITGRGEILAAHAFTPFSTEGFAVKNMLFVGMALAGVALISYTATAQIKKGKTRLALTKQIMSGVVQPHCAAIGKGTKEAPADDKAWEALATNAALLYIGIQQLNFDGKSLEMQ